MKKFTITISQKNCIDQTFQLMGKDIADIQEQIKSALAEPYTIYQCDWKELDDTITKDYTEKIFRLYFTFPFNVKLIGKQKMFFPIICYVKIFTSAS